MLLIRDWRGAGRQEGRHGPPEVGEDVQLDPAPEERVIEPMCLASVLDEDFVDDELLDRPTDGRLRPKRCAAAAAVVAAARSITATG